MTQRVLLDPRKEFYKIGNCTKALYHVLNGELGNQANAEEEASDLLTSAISEKEYPCGFLWATALAVGTEAIKRFENTEEAMNAAISTSAKVSQSFVHQNKGDICWDITNVKWDSKVEQGIYFAKRFILGPSYGSCFNLIDRWTPEAIRTIKSSFNELAPNNSPTMNCASEVVRKMGGSEKDAIVVAGFAGGLGLSGSACGALSAALWYRKLASLRASGANGLNSDPNIRKVMRTFYIQTDSEISCEKICGKKFKDSNDHSDYIRNGGCRSIIEALSEI